MTTAALLETRDLTVAFGGVIAVNRVNVSIAKGEIVGLIGTNGAGKTTFLNMVTGYLQPSSGSIFLDGVDTVGKNPMEMVHLGMARSFQIPQLFQDMTVRDHMLLAIALSNHANSKSTLLHAFSTSEKEAQCNDALSKFGLASLANSKVGLIPQGQRKLIDIAMALLLKPRLLLLDEPTSGVSSAEKLPLMEVVFDAIRAEGVTVLFVEHDMEIVKRYVTRLLAFRDGHMIADGRLEDVMQDATVASAVLREKPNTSQQEISSKVKS